MKRYSEGTILPLVTADTITLSTLLMLSLNMHRRNITKLVMANIFVMVISGETFSYKTIFVFKMMFLLQLKLIRLLINLVNQNILDNTLNL